MKIYIIDLNTKLVVVYYNGGKPQHLFRIHIYVNLFGLKDRLDQTNRQLNHKDTRRVDGVEYRHQSTDSSGTVRFSRMKLNNDDDVRTMFSIFGQYGTKGPIELDTLLVWYVEQIHKSLIRPINYKEIGALLDESEEDISLAYWWSIMFYFIMCFMFLNYVVKINISMVSLWTWILLEDLHHVVKISPMNFTLKMFI